MNEIKCAKTIIKTTVAVLVGVTLLSFSVNADAATLQKKFRDENNDLICVYDSHGKNVYVNKGFSGHCSFNVPDSELEDE